MQVFPSECLLFFRAVPIRMKKYWSGRKTVIDFLYPVTGLNIYGQKLCLLSWVNPSVSVLIPCVCRLRWQVALDVGPERSGRSPTFVCCVRLGTNVL